MLLIVALIFTICHSTDWSMIFIMSREPSPVHHGNELSHLNNTFGERSKVEWQICFLVNTINSSVNTVIYCFKDKQFRALASEMIKLDQFCKVKVNDGSPLEARDAANKDSEVLIKLTY